MKRQLAEFQPRITIFRYINLGLMEAGAISLLSIQLFFLDGNAVAVSRGVSMALGLAKAFCIVLTCFSIYSPVL